jgi:hypothetical protein
LHKKWQEEKYIRKGGKEMKKTRNVEMSYESDGKMGEKEELHKKAKKLNRTKKMFFNTTQESE